MRAGWKTGIYHPTLRRYPDAMPTTDPITPESRQSRIPLSRALWVGVATVVLIVIAVGLRIGVPIYRQQLAFRVIEAAGGCIEPVRGGPDWLRRWAGDEWMKVFDEVGYVIELSDKHVGDDEVASLAGLRSLEYLDLDRTRITDAGLPHLARLLNLRQLRLVRTRVTDAGLEHLAGMTSLEDVRLLGTAITDAGLARLARLTQLKQIDLGYTEVTDAGLAHLDGMTRLEVLGLANTSVTNASVKYLKRLTSLKELDISGTQITADGIGEIQQALPWLELIN